jgi:hypothetical protein
MCDADHDANNVLALPPLYRVLHQARGYGWYAVKRDEAQRRARVQFRAVMADGHRWSVACSGCYLPAGPSGWAANPMSLLCHSAVYYPPMRYHFYLKGTLSPISAVIGLVDATVLVALWLTHVHATTNGRVLDCGQFLRSWTNPSLGRPCESAPRGARPCKLPLRTAFHYARANGHPHPRGQRCRSASSR